MSTDDTKLDQPRKGLDFRAALQSFAYKPPTKKRPAPSDSELLEPEPRRVTRSTSDSAQSLVPSAPAASPGQNKRAAGTPSIEAASTRSPVKRAGVPISSPSPGGAGSRKKKKKKPSGYAPPSQYAHLPNLLTDALAPDLICVFIGVNPGLKTAATGHAYAHPSNLFWKLLHSSGCTPRRCLPSETYALPQLYGLGNTNIVARATANAAELSKEEMDAGVAILEQKVRRCRPGSVAIVGKGIWESIWRVRHRRPISKDDFRYGWQDEAENMGRSEPGDEEDAWDGSPVFVATSTSGLAAGLRPAEKEAIWRQLGERVEEEREKRGFTGHRRLVDGVVVQEEA